MKQGRDYSQYTVININVRNWGSAPLGNSGTQWNHLRVIPTEGEAAPHQFVSKRKAVGRGPLNSPAHGGGRQCSLNQKKLSGKESKVVMVNNLQKLCAVQ